MSLKAHDEGFEAALLLGGNISLPCTTFCYNTWEIPPEALRAPEMLSASLLCTQGAASCCWREKHRDRVAVGKSKASRRTKNPTASHILTFPVLISTRSILQSETITWHFLVLSRVRIRCIFQFLISCNSPLGWLTKRGTQLCLPQHFCLGEGCGHVPPKNQEAGQDPVGTDWSGA